MMNCQDVQDNLERHVLGADDSARGERVQSHLARCATCRAEDRAMRLVLSEVRQESAPAPPRPEFVGALRSALRAETGRQRRKRNVGRFVRVAAAMAACLLLGAGIWAAAEALHTRPTVSPGPQGTPSAGVNEARWRYVGATASPATQADDVVIRGDSLYVLCEKGVAAVDRATGRRRWAWEEPTTGYLAATDTHVFCLARQGDYATELVALSASSGRALWRFLPDDSQGLLPVCRPIALPSDQVCWTHGDAVVLLRGADGKPVWQQNLDHAGPLSGVVADGENLYVGGGAALCCLDRKTGAVRWRRPVGRASRRLRQPLLAACNGRLYYLQRALGPRGRLFCVDLASKRTRWEKRVAGIHCLRAGPDGAYLRGTEIIALSDAGRRRWSRPAEGCGPLALIGDVVCYVDTRQHGRLAALSRRTGESVWNVGGIRSCDAFARVGRTGYIKTQDGTVLAIALK